MEIFFPSSINYAQREKLLCGMKYIFVYKYKFLVKLLKNITYMFYFKFKVYLFYLKQANLHYRLPFTYHLGSATRVQITFSGG